MKLKHYVLLAPIALLLGCSDETKFTCNDKDAFTILEQRMKSIPPKYDYNKVINEDYLEVINKVKVTFDNIQVLEIDPLTKKHLCSATVIYDINMKDLNDNQVERKITWDNIIYTTYSLNSGEKIGVDYDSSYSSGFTQASQFLMKTVRGFMGYEEFEIAHTREWVKESRARVAEFERQKNLKLELKKSLAERITTESKLNERKAFMMNLLRQKISKQMFAGNPIKKGDMSVFNQRFEEYYKVPFDPNNPEMAYHNYEIFDFLVEDIVLSEDELATKNYLKNECLAVVEEKNISTQADKELLTDVCSDITLWEFKGEWVTKLPYTFTNRYPYQEKIEYSSNNPNVYYETDFLGNYKIAYDVLKEEGLLPE